MTTRTRNKQVELDKAHAELHYGKYSAGYNRGLARGRTENEFHHEERQRYRQFLKDLELLNCECDDAILPTEYRKRLEILLWGRRTKIND